jgi:adenylosuccinate lyase|tara:strand:- start:37879 stop:39303 length:1425 start_codon:yes stop_codon:yes gene_type:complete
MSVIPNVLAERYASEAMKALWSPEGKVRLEREFWIAVMRAQQAEGRPISDATIAAYEAAIDQIDLDDIAERERVTRHDVKARLESYNAAAGEEAIHQGMTSRDLTENVEQLQIFRSLELVRDRVVAVLAKLGERALADKAQVFVARTHNVAAQPSTLGKRWAMFGEELSHAFGSLESLLGRYPVRGLKGAVGTQLDLLTLFDGKTETVGRIDQAVAQHLGLPEKLGAVGQVYPRSLDFEVVAVLCQLSSGPANFCRTLRLMAGHELAGEGFAKGQTGSSAMPHKMNARSCERVNGFCTILKGHVAMISGLVGDQWNEGDVSCSVVRRAVLPDAFFALDGLIETYLTILNQMEVFTEVVASENRRYMPFLATTTVLMEAVKAGLGREQAHHIIKENAVATLGDMRTGNLPINDLMDRLAADERLPLEKAQLDTILAEAETLTGLAQAQVDTWAAQVAAICERYPHAASYEPGSVL